MRAHKGILQGDLRATDQLVREGPEEQNRAPLLPSPLLLMAVSANL